MNFDIDARCSSSWGVTMKTACEAVIHTAVVSPFVVLASLIEAATGAVRIASSAADRIAGEPRRRRTVSNDFRAA